MRDLQPREFRAGLRELLAPERRLPGVLLGRDEPVEFVVVRLVDPVLDTRLLGTQDPGALVGKLLLGRVALLERELKIGERLRIEIQFLERSPSCSTRSSSRMYVSAQTEPPFFQPAQR